jgi:hypothetical protein
MRASEANDEWRVGRAYISQKSMATLSDRGPEKDISLQNKDKEVELIHTEPPILHRRCERRSPTDESQIAWRVRAPCATLADGVRVTDVAKCRRQELVACRAALPFEGL